MCNFVEAALLEIISHFAAVDAVFRGMNPEDLTKKFQGALAVALEIRQNFAHVEMPFRTETAGIEQQVARNRHARDRAADVDIREIERLPVERYETLGPDLTDIGPEICQQLALIILAVGPRAVELEPVDTDADDAARARVQTETIEHLLPVVVGLDIEKNLASTGGNLLGFLSNGLDIHDKCRWLPHVPSPVPAYSAGGQVRGGSANLKWPMVHGPSEI